MELDNNKVYLIRVFLGFLISPLIATVIYTLIAFGEYLFFPIVFFVIGVAYTITILVFVPIYLVVIWKHWYKLWQVLIFSFIISFLLFFILFYINDQGINSLGAGGKTFIFDGKLTLDGYINLLIRTILVSLSVVLATVIFWFIVHWKLDKVKDFY